MLRHKQNKRYARPVYIHNYQMLLEEIKNDQNKCSNIPCLEVERLNVLKSQFSPNRFLGFQDIPKKTVLEFF